MPPPHGLRVLQVREAGHEHVGLGLGAVARHLDELAQRGADDLMAGGDWLIDCMIRVGGLLVGPSNQHPANWTSSRGGAVCRHAHSDVKENPPRPCRLHQYPFHLQLVVQPQPRVGRDLVVAAAPRVQLPAGGADQLRQAALVGRVDVLVAGLDDKLPAAPLGGNLGGLDGLWDKRPGTAGDQNITAAFLSRRHGVCVRKHATASRPDQPLPRRAHLVQSSDNRHRLLLGQNAGHGKGLGVRLAALWEVRGRNQGFGGFSRPLQSFDHLLLSGRASLTPARLRLLLQGELTKPSLQPTHMHTWMSSAHMRLSTGRDSLNFSMRGSVLPVKRPPHSFLVPASCVAAAAWSVVGGGGGLREPWVGAEGCGGGGSAGRGVCGVRRHTRGEAARGAAAANAPPARLCRPCTGYCGGAHCDIKNPNSPLSSQPAYERYARPAKGFHFSNVKTVRD